MLTRTQREKAVRLWAQGVTIRKMANELGLTVGEMRGEINYRRNLYPKRRDLKPCEGLDEITCPGCGRVFTPNYHTRKYCSDACKRGHALKRKRERGAR